jgi:hypothetical protein
MAQDVVSQLIAYGAAAGIAAALRRFREWTKGKADVTEEDDDAGDVTEEDDDAGDVTERSTAPGAGGFDAAARGCYS